MPSSESEPAIPSPGRPEPFEGIAAHRPAPPETGGLPLYTPEYTADPSATYRRLREYGPVAPVELSLGVRAWLVLDYAAALEVLRSPETFSTDPRLWRALNAGEIPADSPMLPLLRWQPLALFADEERCRRVRRVVAEGLARVDPGALRDHVGSHADRLIDRFAATGEAELVEQYARALPVRVLSALCGTAIALTERLLDAASAMAHGTEARVALAELGDCATEVVGTRRDNLGEDMVSWMLAHPADLDNDEVVGALIQFIAYGGTLRILIANGLRLMLSDDRFAGDLSDGSLSVDDALSEVLWDDPPVANHAPHFSVRDIDFHGVRIRGGDPVLVSLAAANADPSVVASSRTGNRAHLAWGAGAHACPAQSQARMIAVVAMEKLLDRLPEVELALPVDRLEWRPGPFSRALAALPVRFPPAALSEPAAGNPAARRDTGFRPAAAAAAADGPAAARPESPRAGREPQRAGGPLSGWWRGRER